MVEWNICINSDIAVFKKKILCTPRIQLKLNLKDSSCLVFFSHLMGLSVPQAGGLLEGRDRWVLPRDPGAPSTGPRSRATEDLPSLLSGAPLW